MKRIFWKSLICAMMMALVVSVLCPGVLAAKYTCIKSGCTREALNQNGSARKPAHTF